MWCGIDCGARYKSAGFVHGGKISYRPEPIAAQTGCALQALRVQIRCCVNIGQESLAAGLCFLTERREAAATACSGVGPDNRAGAVLCIQGRIQRRARSQHVGGVEVSGQQRLRCIGGWMPGGNRAQSDHIQRVAVGV